MDIKFDEIGYWSEVKLDIITKYAGAYARILSNQSNAFDFYYIDAFAGFGKHISKETGKEIDGSPIRVLSIKPKFKKYFFIDIKGEKTAYLESEIGNRNDVQIYTGDCNNILINKVFPLCRYKDYKRALCLLDPYGLHLDWNVLEKAGKSKTIEIFLNFPIMDMNRTAIWRNPEKVPSENLERMKRFWGDESWRDKAYEQTDTLFPDYRDIQKRENPYIVDSFKERLRKVAGFKYVPEPLPMRNSMNSVVYYLFFASPNQTGGKIVEDIFEKYKSYG